MTFSRLHLLALLFATASALSAQNQGVKPTGPYAQAHPDATGGATLYNYGTAAGDTALPKEDDNFILTSLAGVGPAGSSLALPFYSKSYSKLYVNNNGLLSFGSGVSSFSPQAFPVSNLAAAIIAPFWADVDTRFPNGGSVWYRTAQDAATLTAIATQLQNSGFSGSGGSNPNLTSFKPTFAQIVTWDKVGYYNNRSTTLPIDYVNTFQAVIASDGVQTYTFFLYPSNAIWWITGALSQGVAAQVGFDAGDGVNFYNGIGTRTNQVYDLSLLSNTPNGGPGVQIFKIDQAPTASDPNNPLQIIYAPQVVAGDLALTTGTNTATYHLQLSDLATGGPQIHTISSPSASGSLQFNELTFDDPTETLVFSGAGVMLANRNGAITQGNIRFTGTSALVALDAGSIDGGTLTFQANSKLYVWAANALTANANLVFDNGSVGAAGTGGTVDLRGLSTSVGTLNSVGTAAGLITSSGTDASTLTIGNTSDGTFNGAIQNGTGLLNIVKVGTGTQILAGTNTFTGAVYVFGGTLELSGGGKISNTTTSGLEGGSLKISGGGSIWTNTMDIFIGRNGAGTLTIEQGGVLNSSFALLGRPGGNGSVYVSGAASQWNNSSGIVLGLEGGSGLMEISGGTVSNLDSVIGRDTSSTGVARVSGGTWANTDFFVGGSGTGTLEISGSGSVSSSYTSVAHNSGGTGTVNLLGGMLTTGQVSEGAGNGTVTFNGGTLRLSGNQSDLFNGFETGDVTLTGAGGTIDTQGFAVTTAYGLSGTGSLTKQGTGTLTLSGANTFTGGIQLNAGTLAVRAALAQRTGTGIQGGNGVALRVLGASDGGSGAVVGATGTATTGTSGAAGNPGGLAVSLGDSSTVENSGILSGGGGGNGASSISGISFATGGTAGASGGGLVLGQHATLINTGTITGGNGGNGGLGQNNAASGATSGTGKAGANGGIAASLDNNATVSNSQILRGGNGGNGGNGLVNSSAGTATAGAGGVGGAALVVGGTSTVTNTLTLTGGNGGNAGTTSGAGTRVGASGGNGGNGVTLGSGSFTNTGTITGGNGGTRSASGSGGVVGTGGAAISGSNLTVINSGILKGGLNGDATQANAITFGGTTNTLELRADPAATASKITGNVLANGSSDTLVLGGGNNSSFDISQLSATAQFRGFESLAKTGAGTWVLTGSGTFAGTTAINAGTLVVNGSLANTATTINSGATLGGSGTVGGLTTFNSGSHLAAGNSPGTLTFTGGLSLNTGAILDFELGTASDLIRVSGGTLTGPGSEKITVNLFDSGGFTAGTYTLVNATGATLTSIGATSFELGTTIAGYTYTFSQAGNQFTLTASAIPEPSAFALLFGAATLAFTAIRRRHRG